MFNIGDRAVWHGELTVTILGQSGNFYQVVSDEWGSPVKFAKPADLVKLA